MGELHWPNYVSKLGWVKWGVLELACPTACAWLFKVRPSVLSKTLSHMWGKLNLPIFLFNSNLNHALPSLLFESFLPSGVVCIVTMMMYRGRILQVLFESFSKGPGSFPYVFITGEVTTLKSIYGPLLLTMGSLSLGDTSRFLMVLLPLKCVCMPYLPQIFLMFSQRSCVWGWLYDPWF